MPQESHWPLIIAGSGIAGLSASIYAGRSNNTPLIIHGDEPGGQLTLTTEVANYPGFPDSINGPELINRMQEQAEKFGAELQHGIITDLYKEDDIFHVKLNNGDEYTSDAFIASSGASARTLDIPGEDEYMGHGLSTCATCDGAFFRDEDMVVVGGGDAAMEEASFLTKFADTVYLIHRREEFRADDYLISEAMEHVENGDIEVIKNTEVTEVLGEDGSVTGVKIAQHSDGYPVDKLDDPDYDVEESELECGAVFYAIGHTPNTEYLKDTDVELDKAGYIQTQQSGTSGQTKTDVDGLFGAGDVVDSYYQQAATASGMGVKAALDADDYLTQQE
jgi:thioredoxin reductase (NADPH)